MVLHEPTTRGVNNEHEITLFATTIALSYMFNDTRLYYIIPRRYKPNALLTLPCLLTRYCSTLFAIIMIGLSKPLPHSKLGENQVKCLQIKGPKQYQDK